MNQIDEQKIGQHISIVGWLHIVGSVLSLGIGAFVFVLLTTIGAISHDAEAFTILSIVGTGVGALLCLLSVPGIIAGIGLLRRKSWGRILAIVMGILNLVNFPIGTIIGVYTIWVLFQDSAAAYFASAQVEVQPA